MSTIKQLREKVKEIDASIIKKLAQRQKLVKRIGRLKKKAEKKIINSDREKQLMHYYERLSVQYQLQPHVVKKIFRLIISYSRKLQK